ncbi:hypothetical protein [Haliovirga abyssi]|uniref:Lipoprotein n=1 Tax=Haliovirga abyssi TaxID=2996794 RepID=A0AAU9DHM3_9FUSO|nr:hypothetical protein [Haliovirga abyssi]BDU50234.1 hypothetical protein HLVA_08030 [Haliovirga abyssi]
MKNIKINIYIFVIITLLFSGCLKDSKLQVNLEKNDQISGNMEAAMSNVSKDGKYSFGDIVNIDLKAITDTKFMSFDIICNTNNLILTNIKKDGFSDSNFVSSYQIKNGYRLFFWDLKNNLKKDDNFAKISLSVRNYGVENIKIDNFIKE